MFCLELFWRFVKLLRDFQCLMEYLTEELFSEAATIRKIMLHQISEGRVKTRLIFWSVNWKNWILEIVFFDEKILKNFLIKKKNKKKKQQQQQQQQQQYLSVFLCQRTKYLLIFQVVGYVVNRLVKK